MNSTPKVCSVCGKEFIPGAQHIYKTTVGRTKYQCSSTCWNIAKSTNRHKDYSSPKRVQG